MLQGIDVTQRVEFVSKEDKGTPKTIFVLKPLSGVDMLNISAMGGLDTSSLVGFITMSVVEIKNFGNKGDSVEDMINSLPSEVLNELLEEINKVNKITGTDKKN